LLERHADAAVEPAEFGPVEAGRGTKRVEPCPPQRLVGVDVPHPGKRPLVEKGGLERGAPTRKTLAEAGGREQRVERLVAHAGAEVRLRLPRFEQEPRAEAPHVSIRDVRSVV